MILVLLGTQNNSFYRLLDEIQRLIKNGIIKDKVIVQCGYTKYQSNDMELFDLLPKDELDKLQSKADLIICHGGVGSIISSLKKDKKVIAVPRLHEYDEHVNNHQKEIVENFNNMGYIIGIEDVKNLEQAILKSEEFIPKKYKENNTRMLETIENFIDNC